MVRFRVLAGIILFLAIHSGTSWPDEGLPPAGAQDRLCFLNLSDLHASSSQAKQGSGLSRSIGLELRSLVSEFNRLDDLDFVVLTGDLVVDPSPPNLEEVRDILNTLRVPYYVIPGNHDLPDPARSGKPDLPSSFARVFEGRGPFSGQTYWSEDPKEGWHLVGLDSTVPGTWEGEISPAQLRWLKEDLERNAGKATILLSHHGLIAHHAWDEEGAWRGYEVRNAEQVRTLLEHYPSVCIVVSGHHHFCSYRERNGIAYVSCPALASWPCRYSRFEILGGRLNFSTHPIPSRDLVEKARKTLLGFRPVRDRFPPGKKGEEEMFRTFLGPEQLSVPLPRRIPRVSLP